MKVAETELQGLKLIEPDVFGDKRGYFLETYSKRRYSEFGIDCEFVQDNRSFSAAVNTIRGIHFQRAPYAQAKLITCTMGEIMDIAVDLRHESPTYLKWRSFILSAENKHQLFIPKGFGHTFITLCDNCMVEYKADEYYNPQSEAGICWNDPILNIEWGTDSPILSAKDKTAPCINSDEIYF